MTDGDPNRRCVHGKLFTESCPRCGYVHPRDRADPACQQCKGQGFYFRLPPKMNPFAASIEVTAANMRRITCHCTTHWPSQPVNQPHDPEGTRPMSRLDAPWTQEQVDAINAWQKLRHVHPFTCREHSDYSLHACSSELYCQVPGCTYEQRWVHDFMARPQKEPPR